MLEIKVPDENTLACLLRDSLFRNGATYAACTVSHPQAQELGVLVESESRMRHWSTASTSCADFLRPAGRRWTPIRPARTRPSRRWEYTGLEAHSRVKKIDRVYTIMLRIYRSDPCKSF